MLSTTGLSLVCWPKCRTHFPVSWHCSCRKLTYHLSLLPSSFQIWLCPLDLNLSVSVSFFVSLSLPFSLIKQHAIPYHHTFAPSNSAHLSGAARYHGAWGEEPQICVGVSLSHLGCHETGLSHAFSWQRDLYAAHLPCTLALGRLLVWTFDWVQPTQAIWHGLGTLLDFSPPWQLSLASVWLRSTHSGSMAWSELIIFDTKIYVYISQFRKKNPLSSAGREALWRYRVLNNRQIHFNINIRKTEFHFLDCITKWRKKLRKSNRKKKTNPSKW